ncbi:MAG: hypothetical protein ACK5RO_04280 [Pseudobdellovibrionaceae bacterium]
MKNMIILFLASLLVAGAAYGQNSQIDLQAPSSINQVAEVYVVISPKFLQAKIARYKQVKNFYETNELEKEFNGNLLYFQWCLADGCNSVVSEDITGKRLAIEPLKEAEACIKSNCDPSKGLTKIFKLRPGNYALVLDGKKFTVSLQANQRITVPLVEVYLPQQSVGNIYATATDSVRDSERIRKLRQNVFESNFGGVDFPVKLDFKNSVKSLAEQMPYNTSVYIWSYCQEIRRLMSASSVASRTCQQIQIKKSATKTDLESVLFGDDDGVDPFVFQMVDIIRNHAYYSNGRFGDVIGDFTHEDMQKESLAELNRRLTWAADYVTKFSRASERDNSLFVKTFNLSQTKVALYKWRISEGEARLALPGQYTILFQSESGQSVKQVLNITGQNSQVNLVVQ